MQNGIRPGVVVRNGTSRSFNITQVIYSDQGTCTCVPVNKPGRRSSAVLNVTVQGKMQQDLSPLKTLFLSAFLFLRVFVYLGMA